jgi:hypothetical protein
MIIEPFWFQFDDRTFVEIYIPGLTPKWSATVPKVIVS